MYEFPSALLIQLIFERCTGTDKGRFMGLKEIYIRRVVEREHEKISGNDEEQKWDKLLQIHTTGRDDSNSDQYRYPYDPTPYTVLERFANSGLLCRENTLLDYGCGKGRADFFLSYQTRCHTIGVEYNERIYEKAVENREQGVAAGRTEFVLADAVQFSVPAEVDRIYFFNPFSIEILKKVLARVLESYYENPRELLLFFYYPSDEYISYLMTVDELIFSDEIDCRDLFPGENKRERIVVFEVE